MKRIFTGAALVGLLVMGSAAFAESEQHAPMPQMPMMGPGMMGPGMMGHGGAMGPGMMGGGQPGMMMSHGPMVEGRLAYLKAELAVTDAQTEAWNGYASAVKARAATMRDMHATMMKTSGSAVDRLRARTQAMESMTESLKALIPATEAFYNVLTDEQKKKADVLLGDGCCM